MLLTKQTLLAALLGSFVATLTGCGDGNPALTDEEFAASAPAPAPTAVTIVRDTGPLGAPLGLTRELVSNGSFDRGSADWTQSTRRAEWGSSESIIGGLPSGVPTPLNGRTTVARMCGYATASGTVFNGSSGNCNDSLTTPIVVPAGTKKLTLSATAYARYDCTGSLHGALTVAIRPLDGLSSTTPRALQARESVLPAGTWQDVSLVVDDIPGIATQSRSFTLIFLFSTTGACKPPNDSGTFVVLTDISARAD